ncbi:hypothetical protein [Chitinophaga sp. MM2321]|uniref:hypothetical protein n=1 Tax=Chitinophaga sp. MM2321 TaxID=3137178 RepID=UPI0032D5B101
MEKISALIEKLQELKNSGADLQAISYYVQLLQAEVLHVRNRQHQQDMQERQGQIAVIMPAQHSVPAPAPVTPAAEPVATTPVTPAPVAPAEEPVVNTPATIAAQTTTLPAEKTTVPATDLPQAPAAADPIPAKPEPVVTPQPIPTLAAHKPVPPTERERTATTSTLFDLAEAPAKNGYKGQDAKAIRKDLNDLVGNSNASINDQLRQQQKVEVAQKLGEMPINDLRHAIGINDKYQFIQELFRGDKDLYERSVKTINECNSMQEADYWIQREIKIIQGWQDDHHLVQHFYSLLRKRFS